MYRRGVEVEYDSIRHLAMALHFGRWRETGFAVLTVYGDASGSAVQRNEKAQVVAGFLQNAGIWCDFDLDWRAFLARHDLTYLHMTELPNDVEVRANILDDAMGVIEKHCLKVFVTVIDSADFQAYQAIHGSHEYSLGRDTHAYPFATYVHISMIETYCDLKRTVRPSEYIYEAGDPFQDDFRKVMRAKGYPEPIFRPKKMADPSKNILPLQACDFLAYEILNGYRQGVIVDAQLQGESQPRNVRPTKHLLRFMTMDGERGIYSRDNLPKLVEAHKTLDRLQQLKDDGESV